MKNKSYPRKDEHGRLLTESSCLPFILTSMGGLCEEGHEFLRDCRKRNPEKTKHLIDVLVTCDTTFSLGCKSYEEIAFWLGNLDSSRNL